MTPDLPITVFIPTFNGARYLREILAAVYDQRCEKEFEVLVIDSGSTDETLEIIAEHPGIRLIEIPNSQFQHGRTRNLAASEARGEIVVFLTQSATPVSDRWLGRLTSHFDADGSVMAVYGRHLPRPDCNPYVAHDVERTFLWISPQDETRYDKLAEGVTLDDLTRSERDRRRFFSNANSAVRRSYLLEHPFREVEYAEDQLLGVDLLEAGFTKVYDARATVLHSHGYPLRKYFRRRFDEYWGLIENGEMVTQPGALRLTARAVARWCRTLLWMVRSSRYSAAQKVRWSIGSLGFALADSMALRAAWGAVDQPGRRVTLSLDARERGTEERVIQGD